MTRTNAKDAAAFRAVYTPDPVDFERRIVRCVRALADEVPLSVAEERFGVAVVRVARARMPEGWSPSNKRISFL